MPTRDCLQIIRENLSNLYGLSEEKIERVNVSMDPDFCAPAVAYLAHESCQLNGEVLQVGMGGVARMAFVAAEELVNLLPTAESIAESIETVLDIDGAQVPSTDDILIQLRSK